MKEWHFLDGDEQRGPVTEGHLVQLRNAGTLGRDTLVWKDGMEEWLPIHSVTLNETGDAAGSILASAAENEVAVCAVSGRKMLKSDMLAYGESWIAPDRKGEFLQRLRESAPIGSVGSTGDDVNQAQGNLGFGYMMRRSYLLFHQNIAMLLGLYFVVWLPCNFLMEYVDYHYIGAENFKGSYKLQRFFDNFIGIIAFGAVVHFLFCRTNQQNVTFGEAMGNGFKCWGKLWVTRFLVSLCVILSLIALIIPGIYVLVRLAVAPTVVVTEDNWATDAIRRSFELTKGRFWAVFGYGCLIFGSLVVLASILAIPIVFVPSLDNWFASAVFACLVGVLEIYIVVFFYTLYEELLVLDE